MTNILTFLDIYCRNLDKSYQQLTNSTLPRLLGRVASFL